ncbi:hypothetical protein PR048_010394 [Dryococelus australis]|uniref:HAT C-terminal dimerisation domain-containing protein n=1 Tax=Dryococelus australis TaxID=614101 RepID=A0ABQ9I2M0_9NEOP|nr:hypothetical protein PR048_010394 [Dryococelus australis]
MLQATCFAGLYRITGEIEERFNQPRFAASNNLERLLNLKAGKMRDEAEKSGVCVKGFQTEMELLCSTIPSPNLNSLVEKMKLLQPDSRLLFNHVGCILQNSLVAPIYSATAERSFSLPRSENST